MLWRIELFGGPRLLSESGQSTERFATQKTASLLAYLAFHLPRSHSREVLAELFWPDRDPQRSRNSLAGVLFALRKILGEALVTDKLRVGLDPALVTTDLTDGQPRPVEEFLPGLYDDWVVAARERLAVTVVAAPPSAMPIGRSQLAHPPHSDDSFVGRVTECETVRQALAGPCRLLTLKGMGGVGKTRLAQEVGQQCRALFPGGTIWVSVDHIRTGDDLLRRIATTLRLTLQPAQPLSEQIGQALGMSAQPVLLILDNTEQIADAGSTIRDLLGAAPACTCLVTSRHKLNLRAEHVIELRPLPLLDAERLFRERATTGGGTIPPHDPAVIQLCQRLDGLPLALELAAAHTTSLSPQQLLTRLTERFRLLQSQKSDLPPRQRTLRTAIDWSYDMLGEPEQQLLQQLSVFVGPFSLADAEAVCIGPQVLEGILALRESSLLSREHGEFHPEANLHLLESLSAYAAERLAADPELCQRVRERHAVHFLDLAETQLARLRTPAEADALSQLELLAANLRAALALGPPELAPRLALALARPMQRRGFFREAIIPLEQALALARTPELLWERAGLHFDLGEYEQTRLLADEARGLFLAQNHAPGVGRSENLIGQAFLQERRWDDARRWLQRAHTTLQQQTPPNTLELAIVQNNLGLVEMEDPAGSTETAMWLLADALAVRRHHGDQHGVAVVVNNLGNLAFAQRDWDAAHRHFLESLEVEAALGAVFGIARALNNLGETAEQQGHPERALRLYVAAHRLFSELRHGYAAYTEALITALRPPLDGDGTLVAALRQEYQGLSAAQLARTLGNED